MFIEKHKGGDVRESYNDFTPRPSMLQGQLPFWRGLRQQKQEDGLFPVGKPALPAAVGVPSV